MSKRKAERNNSNFEEFNMKEWNKLEIEPNEQEETRPKSSDILI